MEVLSGGARGGLAVDDNLRYVALDVPNFTGCTCRPPFLLLSRQVSGKHSTVLDYSHMRTDNSISRTSSISHPISRSLELITHQPAALPMVDSPICTTWQPHNKILMTLPSFRDHFPFQPPQHQPG